MSFDTLLLDQGIPETIFASLTDNQKILLLLRPELVGQDIRGITTEDQVIALALDPSRSTVDAAAPFGWQATDVETPEQKAKTRADYLIETYPGLEAQRPKIEANPWYALIAGRVSIKKIEMDLDAIELEGDTKNDAITAVTFWRATLLLPATEDFNTVQKKVSLVKETCAQRTDLNVAELSVLFFLTFELLKKACKLLCARHDISIKEAKRIVRQLGYTTLLTQRHDISVAALMEQKLTLSACKLLYNRRDLRPYDIRFLKPKFYQQLINNHTLKVADLIQQQGGIASVFAKRTVLPLSGNSSAHASHGTALPGSAPASIAGLPSTAPDT